MSNDKARFKTVLKVRKHQEKMTQQQLVHIQDLHQREQEALDRLHDKREAAVKETLSFGKAKVTDLQTERAFIFKLSKQIQNQSEKVSQIRQKEEGKRVELTERAQSRQMVEKLDERRQAEAARAADKREQELIDELANRRTAMKTSHERRP